MQVSYKRSFEKQLAKLSQKEKDFFKKRYALFLEDTDNELLNIHQLHGEHSGCKSFNVTSNLRVIYKKLNDTLVVFIAIGTHSELYE